MEKHSSLKIGVILQQDSVLMELENLSVTVISTSEKEDLHC
jgi:hypothetical protein